MVHLAAGLHHAEVEAAFIGGGQAGVVVEDRDRAVEGRAERHHPRHAHLGHREVAELVEVGLDRIRQLAQAVGAELAVGRPTRLVEGTTGSAHRPLGVGHRGVGDVADDFLGGRVDAGERAAAFGRHEGAVDQQVRVGQAHVHIPHSTPWRGNHVLTTGELYFHRRSCAKGPFDPLPATG
jgi:hypothetical protein